MPAWRLETQAGAGGAVSGRETAPAHDGLPEASAGSRVGHTPELGSNFHPKWNLIWVCLLLHQRPRTPQHLSGRLPSLPVTSLRAEVGSYIRVHCINTVPHAQEVLNGGRVSGFPPSTEPVPLYPPLLPQTHWAL